MNNDEYDLIEPYKGLSRIKKDIEDLEFYLGYHKNEVLIKIPFLMV